MVQKTPQITKTYTYEEVFQEIEGDPDNVLVNFPTEVLEQAGWKEGDLLEVEASNGILSFKIKKE